eukprot:TRINITY_DN11932_c0_g1_i1.p1 TRINITY_DN11932_c0_g1~~TRINITY_DN11932_c0_g1_i1.p1  ORF type:complete len:575 (-),score=107.67 TRINITY_DN11932_c0_g1_i1:14-1738(-)
MTAELKKTEEDYDGVQDTGENDIDGEGADSDEEDEYFDDNDDDELNQKLGELRDMMGNFYMHNQQYSSVDYVLGKESFTLEELLEQDDFLPDLRRSKQTLFTYLQQDSVLEKLIKYISTEEREEDTPEPEKRKRFAHLAYEALQTDKLKESLINSEEMLDEFFSFLDIAIDMDPLRCAYFSRLVELLFERYAHELLVYLKKKSYIVAKFVWHINNQYIAESLFRLIDSQISHQWLTDEDLIPLLMFKMAEAEEEETQENTASVFVEILDLFVPFPYSVLTNTMFHSDVVSEQWEQFMSVESKDLNRIQNGLSVAIAILNLSFERNMSEETPIFMSTAAKYIPFLLGLLKEPQNPDKEFDMAFGKLKPPFGFLRLKILEFLSALLNTRYPSVIETFWAHKDLFSTLLDIFLFYKWNNITHFYVDQILSQSIAIGSASNIEEVLIDHCKLLSIIISVFSKETTRTCGYIGHFTRIANTLCKTADSNPDLHKVLMSREDWQECVTGALKKTNTVNSTPIAGGKPAAGVPLSEDVISQFSMMGHMGETGGDDEDHDDLLLHDADDDNVDPLTGEAIED